MGLATELELFGQEDILTFCRKMQSAASRCWELLLASFCGAETLNLWVSNGINLSEFI